MLHRRPFSWQHLQNIRQFFIWILFVWYGDFFARHKNNFLQSVLQLKILASKGFQFNLLTAFLVVNRNNYCCLPTCRFYYRLMVWILNLKPTRVIFSSGKYNCSYWHLSWLQMLHTAANSAHTLMFPKLWPTILLAGEVFKSMAQRLFLAKLPWNQKGITKLTWDQMGKEINGKIRKSKQDTHHQNFWCFSWCL